jgi:uncharacterized Tic20 family protein
VPGAAAVRRRYDRALPASATKEGEETMTDTNIAALIALAIGVFLGPWIWWWMK